MGTRLFAIRVALSPCAMLFTLCACTLSSQGSNPPARFYGLSQGNVSSFTSTSDGCIISLLFDDFRAPLLTKSKAAIPLRRFSLASSAGAVGQPITFDIRGFTANAPGSKIQLKVGSKQLQLEPKDSNFEMRAQAPATATDTPVEVLLQLPPSSTPAPADVQVTVDSIDVSLGGCGAKK